LGGFRPSASISHNAVSWEHFHAPLVEADAIHLLEAVNKRRKVLGLPEIAELTADTKFDAGLSATAKTPELYSFTAPSADLVGDSLREWERASQSGRSRQGGE